MLVLDLVTTPIRVLFFAADFLVQRGLSMGPGWKPRPSTGSQTSAPRHSAEAFSHSESAFFAPSPRDTKASGTHVPCGAGKAGSLSLPRRHHQQEPSQVLSQQGGGAGRKAWAPCTGRAHGGQATESVFTRHVARYHNALNLIPPLTPGFQDNSVGLGTPSSRPGRLRCGRAGPRLPRDHPRPRRL